MRTVFISGNDTGVGKTRVTGLLARELVRRGARVQVVKAVETGRRPGERGDADDAADASKGAVEAHTLFRFVRPIAPLDAARLEGRTLSLRAIAAAIGDLPPCDWRLVEGAGGLAVPVDEDGSDWADLSFACRADRLVLVVEDRLGAINQSRLLASHCKLKRVPGPLFYLNALGPIPPDVARGNRDALARAGLACIGTGAVEDLVDQLVEPGEGA